MRPQVLDDVFGQDHIVGQGRLLRRAIQADRLSSIIFYGPPGTGKTSLARVIANTTKSTFESLNAVLSGIKDIRETIERSQERRRLYGKRSILFVDEVHRWNKAQQDALLPWVENGTVILVGATTENPFFEVNKALVSRSRIFALKPICPDDLRKTADRALTDRERGYGLWNVRFEQGALEHLIEVASGDARSLLNALELAVETSLSLEGTTEWPPSPGTEICITLDAAQESIQRRAVLYDRDGDYHFDTISAFIKSVRGSDPDAALYWLAKMLAAGEDPHFIFRRMIILASEDVGLADPNAITLVMNCAQAFDRIGFPEGNFPLAEACLYLATAPKSNSALAFFDALKEVEREDAQVPTPLRDPSRDADGFGHGKGYIYPHAYRDHWAAQQYLPDSLKGRTFYSPSCCGYEGRIREDVLRKREIQTALILDSALSKDVGEILTWKASTKGHEGWVKRLESGRSASLLFARDAIMERAAPKRQTRVLLSAADDGLLLWETLRRCPEGLSAAVVHSVEAQQALLALYANMYENNMDENAAPLIAVCPNALLPTVDFAQNFFACSTFDLILARSPFRRSLSNPRKDFAQFAAQSAALLVPQGKLIFLETPPHGGQRIFRILLEHCKADAALAERIATAEEQFFQEPKPWGWTEADLNEGFARGGFTLESSTLDCSEERLLTERDISAWFDAEHSVWGAFIQQRIGNDDFACAHKLLLERSRQGPIGWKWKSLLVSAVKTG
ncbi:ATPase AAA [Spirochaetia bacterium]|nr:ATPase AAA [Spirochaetia bacterium]